MVTKCTEGLNLPSCKIYELLSTQNGDSGNYSDDCKRLKSRLPYSGILELCRKLEGNLVNFYGREEESNTLNYNCEFIHYWLFHEMFNNSSLTEYDKLDGVKSQFRTTWNNILGKLKIKKKKCEPKLDFFYLIPRDDLMFRKDIYDYIYNYDIFDKMDSATEHIDNRYCKYLSSMHEKYTKFKDSCPHNKKICFHVSKSLEEYNPEKLCIKLKCRGEDFCSKHFEGTSAQRVLGAQGSFEEEKREDYREGEDVTSIVESQTSTIVTTAGSSLLGLFITSFLLFKLTPIRSWLNNQIVQRKNIEEYMDEEASNEILDNYFLHENREPGKSGYGIAYHSVENIGNYDM
ncbi:PIR Superfamily Protein [Plasmodium ovale wallikeri]|uniref:PIR Superfamily Protein n=1 Tax=Plasmodium ovale wallikeri TaxID=864142 RepID=A0A1A9ALG7_PLAOA|nr:PIR Superfamily Protein [Plasmodium ovale wallikeri]SBT57037.1 PIR Superfamily Protein [Plasmodium ovale wallikeri]